MKIVAHRGGSAEALENTKAAILNGIKSHADATEIDVRKTKDDRFVVHHDKTLKRIYGLDVRIADHTEAELLAMTGKEEHPLLTLELAIKTAGKHRLFIEVKDSSSAFHLSKCDLPNGTCVLSFKHKDLLSVPASQFNTILLSRLNIFGIVRKAKYGYHTAIDVWWPLLIINPFLYYIGRRSGLEVLTFTVNLSAVAWLYSKLFPELWLTTDHPTKMRRYK